MSDDKTTLAARLKDGLMSYYLVKNEALYRKTGNAVHAWRAYRYARIARMPVPPWVFAYFDGCAAALTSPTPKGTPNQAVLKVLGLGSRGRGMVMTQAETDQHKFDVLQQIYELLDVPNPPTLYAAQKRVAAETGQSYSNVRRIYDDWTKRHQL